MQPDTHAERNESGSMRWDQSAPCERKCAVYGRFRAVDPPDVDAFVQMRSASVACSDLARFLIERGHRSANTMTTKNQYEFTLNQHTSFIKPHVKVFLDARRTPGNIDDDEEIEMKQEGTKLLWKGSNAIKETYSAGMFVRIEFVASTGAKWHLKVISNRDGKDHVAFDAGETLGEGSGSRWVRLMQ